MIKVDTMVDTVQAVEIGMVGCHIEVALNRDKSIEKGLSMFKITGEILGEKILEENKIRMVNILEEDIEVS